MTDKRMGCDARALVAALARPSQREAAFAELVRLGPSARDAIYDGLGDGRWEVRRGCLVWLFQFPGQDDASHVKPLLRDPRAKVRHTALVVLERTSCSDLVPLLLERALEDESVHVRRSAVTNLAWAHAHPDLAGFFAEIAARETDAKLRKQAAVGLARSRAC
jgi:HEAT repeat protein